MTSLLLGMRPGLISFWFEAQVTEFKKELKKEFAKRPQVLDDEPYFRDFFSVEKCGYVEEDSKYELMRRIGNVDPPYLNEWMSKKTSEWVCEAVGGWVDKRKKYI